MNEAFDVVTSPLRRTDGHDGVPHPLLIEASAGSGKTWTLAHLAVRFMLEDDVTPDELLLVTFTRDAARELRGRVRSHLRQVIDLFERLEAGTATLEHEWQRHFAALEPARRSDLLAVGRARLGSLDSLHAQTIDSFAAEHVESAARTTSRAERQWRQAGNEVIAAHALDSPDDAALFERPSSFDTVRVVARALYDAGLRVTEGRVTTPPSLLVLPTGEAAADDDGPTRAARVQRDLAVAIVERFGELLDHARATTFSEVMLGLLDRTRDAGSATFVARMRQRFRVVMIDEFQDTNHLQWEIFTRLFLDAPETRLVVVGDPKQAIYLFRSGSVETFLAVRSMCEARGVPITVLPDNHRSEPALLECVNQFFAGTSFRYGVDDRGDLAIGFTPARPFLTGDETPHRLSLDDASAPMHLRVGRGGAATIEREVADYVALLHARGVAYGAVAVLCRTRYQCLDLQRHLSRRGIPATTSADESVATSRAAFQLRLLLVALADPDESAHSEVLRLSWFRGALGRDGEPDELVNGLGEEFSRHGVAAIARFLHHHDVLATVVSLREGERHLTDLWHLAELLGAQCRTVRSLPLVLDWLDDLAASDDTDPSVRARRLETESDAVRVMTVHKAKGLEFDTVLVPFLNESYPKVTADGGRALRQWVDVEHVVVDAGSGTSWGDPTERDRRVLASIVAEQRRLAYVALTRAKRHLVVWLDVTVKQPLGGEFSRLVYDRARSPSVVINRPFDDVAAMFVSAARKSKDTVERAVKEDPVAALNQLWNGTNRFSIYAIGDGRVAGAVERAAVPAGAREARVYEAGRAPRVGWERRRWSYTELAKTMKSGEMEASEPDDAGERSGGYDETARDADWSDAVGDVAPGVRTVFGTLAGARLGAAVHGLLERLVGADLDAAAVATAVLEREGFGAPDIAENLETIVASTTALLARATGPLLEGLALRELARDDVAREMRFVLALGEQRRRERLAAAARAILESDRSGPDGGGLFRDYFSRLARNAEGLDEGVLIGSLDLVVRRGDGRFAIVDYKTDQIPGLVRPYGATRLYASMEEEHYPLQALLYSIALHRHLRGSLRGYDPDTHLAGVGYYYLRVVGDPSAQPEDGFAAWPVTPAAVARASDALGDVA